VRSQRAASDAGKKKWPPWSMEDIGAAFIVKDAGGQKLGFVYYEEEPGRQFEAAPD
jgi:hypothetical protein